MPVLRPLRSPPAPTPDGTTASSGRIRQNYILEYNSAASCRADAHRFEPERLAQQSLTPSRDTGLNPACPRGMVSTTGCTGRGSLMREFSGLRACRVPLIGLVWL